MVAVDTTQASASNRLKIYVNGEQETSFAYSSGDPAQDSQNLFNNILSQTKFENKRKVLVIIFLLS